jgi:hypothetical protein
MAALQGYMVPTGALGGSVLDQSRKADAERTLSTVFDVNPIVARIRLEDLFAPENGGQMLL